MDFLTLPWFLPENASLLTRLLPGLWPLEGTRRRQGGSRSERCLGARDLERLVCDFFKVLPFYHGKSPFFNHHLGSRVLSLVSKHILSKSKFYNMEQFGALPPGFDHLNVGFFNVKFTIPKNITASWGPLKI